MKKMISLILIFILSINMINVTSAATKSDKDLAVELIDGLTSELKAVGYNNFYSYNLNDDSSKASAWKVKYDDVLDSIRLNNRKANDEKYNKVFDWVKKVDNFTKTVEYYDWVYEKNEAGEVVEVYKKVSKEQKYTNSYYYYLSHLVFLKQIIKQEKPKSLNQLIKDIKTINTNKTYDCLTWARNTYWTYILLPEETLNHNCVNGLMRAYGFDEFESVANNAINKIGNFPEVKAPTINVTLLNKTTTSIVNYIKNNTTPKANKDLNILNLKTKVKKNKVIISFKEVNFAIKYQIQISLKKNFKKAKAYNVIDPIKTIKKLKRKKTYYIRVRAVGCDELGKWSIKKFKTK